jgi:hypothetical protein
MNRKSTETTVFTVHKFAQIAGFDRQSLAARLEEIRARPVAKSPQGAGLYHLRDLVRALLGGDIEAERLRLVRFQADKLESQLAERRRDLIPVAEVIFLGQKHFSIIKDIIWRSPLDEDARRKILHELCALKDHDWQREYEDFTKGSDAGTSGE